jgi:hypothetical protein
MAYWPVVCGRFWYWSLCKCFKSHLCVSLIKFIVAVRCLARSFRLQPDCIWYFGIVL